MDLIFKNRVSYRKNVRVWFGDEIVQSLVKRVDNSLKDPNLHFTKQNLVKGPSQS